jgi:hypothetical protein
LLEAIPWVGLLNEKKPEIVAVAINNRSKVKTYEITIFGE